MNRSFFDGGESGWTHFMILMLLFNLCLDSCGDERVDRRLDRIERHLKLAPIAAERGD